MPALCVTEITSTYSSGPDFFQLHACATHLYCVFGDHAHCSVTSRWERIQFISPLPAAAPSGTFQEGGGAIRNSAAAGALGLLFGSQAGLSVRCLPRSGTAGSEGIADAVSLPKWLCQFAFSGRFCSPGLGWRLCPVPSAERGVGFRWLGSSAAAPGVLGPGSRAPTFSCPVSGIGSCAAHARLSLLLVGMRFLLLF